jgi:hypothetical protein
MDEPLFMSGFEGLSDLPQDGKRFFETETSAGEPLGKGLAGHHLHDEKPEPLGLLETMEGRDVGMIQGREKVSFPLETRQLLLVSREIFREKLEGHLPAELRVASSVDLTHATHAEKGRDIEGSEPCPLRDRHGASASTRRAKATTAGQRSDILFRRRGRTACIPCRWPCG